MTRSQIVYSIVLAVLAIALLYLMPQPARAAECLENPMDGIEENRWEVLDNCYQTEGLVNLYWSSSGGAYWIQLQRPDGSMVGAKIYPQYRLQRPEGFERVRVTGALVRDYGDLLKGGAATLSTGMVQVVPVWKLERVDIVRQYNEERADGWYMVNLWRDGRWTDELLLPSHYSAAGIV